MKLTTAQTYIARVDRAIDLIIDDLGGDLSLARLARYAGFSPFHFHRIFKSVTGSTIGNYIDQVRMDRAVGLLASQPVLPLSEAALICGLGSASSLTKAFRRRFEVSPRAYDIAAHKAGNRRLKLNAYDLDSTTCGVESFRPEVLAIAARTVAYRRVVSPYEAGNLAAAIDELVGWSSADGIPAQPLSSEPWTGSSIDGRR